jgi:hypothetical protein
MASINPISVPSKRLSESITGASMSFKTNNILGWDGVALTSADFGTVAYVVFRNSAGTLLELCEIDPTTIASASITISRRGLKFTGDLTTEVSGNKLSWVKGDTIVEFGTDVPQLLKHFVDILSNQTIGGTKTFSSLPTIPATPLVSTDAASKGYVDGVAVAGAPNADTATKGIAEEATQAEVDAGTAAGGTSARLFINPSTHRARAFNDYALDAVGTDAYAITITPAITAYAGGQVFVFEAGTANTGACTLAVSGLTAKTIKKSRNLDLVTGDIKAGQIVMVVYDAGDDTMQLLSPSAKAQVSQDGSEIYAADAAGSDTYAVTLSPAPTAYTTGMVVNFKAQTANTGAATLNVNGLGAVTIKRNNDKDLLTGDIEASQIVTVIYDGTNFQMQSQNANPDQAMATLCPMPAAPHLGSSTASGQTNAVINWCAYVIPIEMSIGKVSVRHTATAVAGTMDIAMYSNDGQTKFFEITTGTLSGDGITSTTVSPSVIVKPGVYYFGYLVNSTGNFTMQTYSSNGEMITGVSGSQRLSGETTGTPASLPSTVDPTTISTTGTNLYFLRLDN